MRYRDTGFTEEPEKSSETLSRIDQESQTDELFCCNCNVPAGEAMKEQIRDTVDREDLLPLDMSLKTTNCMDDAYYNLYKVTKQAFELIGADLYSLYIKHEYSSTLHLYNPAEDQHTCYSCLTQNYDVTVATHVLGTRKSVNVGDIIQEDSKFPGGIGKRGPKTQAVLAVPILLDNELCTGVVEICRDLGKPPFSKQDEQLLSNYSKWGELIVRYAKLYKVVKHQNDFNDLLLNVTKSLYMDIVQGKTANDLSVIDRILEQAKDLINAERCSLFLFDNETDELYAKTFDIGALSNEWRNGIIRTPSKKGLIGDTFQTGKINNVEDAYTDTRFNRDIDKLTGYKTRNLLCVPIHSDRGTVGVTVMVNKKLERGFSLTDEKAFYMLTVFCGLALYTSNLENRLARMMTVREIETSVLNYYRICSQKECEVIAAMPPIHVSSFQLSRYDFDTWSCTQDTQVRLFIGLFEDLFPGMCDRNLLVRFTLTVKCNQFCLFLEGHKDRDHIKMMEKEPLR